MTRKALSVAPGCFEYVEPCSLNRIVDIRNGKAVDDSKRQRPQIQNDKQNRFNQISATFTEHFFKHSPHRKVLCCH